MPRPQARQPGSDEGDETWARVLTAAQRLLDEMRPADVSLRRIADTAGVALSTVQYYFPSKEGLFESLLDAYYGRLAAVAASHPPPQGPEGREAWIANVVRAHYRFAIQERSALRLRTHLNAGGGRLSPKRDVEVLQPALHMAEAVLTAPFPERVGELRLIVQTMSFLITKYALMTDDELQGITGKNTNEDAVVDVEAHLSLVAGRFLLAGSGSEPVASSGPPTGSA